MKLLQLKLKNFKGIKSFTLDAKGQNISVFGDNGSGKTSLEDAYQWLLFDKDSAGRKDFDIKTLDENGEPLHGIEHGVEGVFDIEGRKRTFRKIYAEKWTKKRGSATSAFTGHTVDHFIDGVPVKKGEYDKYITDIVNENVFKLLTSPAFFNQLHWQERREILLELCGDVSDAEVIASNRSLTKLPEILGNHTLENFRKVIAASRSEINKELNKIPVRIDEVTQSLPNSAINGTSVDKEALIKDIADLKNIIRNKEQQISRIESGGEIAEKTRQLREIEGELIEIRNKLQEKHNSSIQEKQVALSRSKEVYMDLKGDIYGLESAINRHNENITALQKQIENLREQWYAEEKKNFEFEQDDTCPTCGQLLPAEKLTAAREKALQTFNRQKAERLESITAGGMKLKARLDEEVAAKPEAEKKLRDAQMQITKSEDAVSDAQKEIDSLRLEAESYTEDLFFIRKLQAKKAIEGAIQALKTGNSNEVAKLRQEILSLEESVQKAEKSLTDADRYAQGQKRIQELKDRERQLAAEYEELEEQLYLTEEFIRSKVQMLEEKMNSCFKLARFKLFETQINGGLAECCETMYLGVPYTTALNNSARINVGLDIINTLSERYGFDAPIFVDNAEAVTRLIETRAQVIKLVVSEQDKALRVELKNKKAEVA